MKFISQFLFVFLVLASLQYNMNCWWEFGHLIVAQIAENELSLQDPELFKEIQQVVGALNFLVDAKDRTFVQGAPWPDDLIAINDFSFLNTWHYKNTPIHPSNPPPAPEDNNTDLSKYNLNNFQSSTNDIIYGLEQCKKVVNKCGTKINAANSMMTRYLIHLVGDSHQPLHGSGLFNSEFPEGDRGGNLYQVSFGQESSNLHALWDSGCWQWKGKAERPLNSTSKKYIENFVSDLVKEYPRSAFSESLKRIEPSEWVDESWRYAWKYAYQPLLESAHPNELTQQYLDNCLMVSKKRIVLAGYRLTDTLKRYIRRSKDNKEKEQEQCQRD